MTTLDLVGIVITQVTWNDILFVERNKKNNNSRVHQSEIITIYFLIFTLLTTNYRLLGEKVPVFPISKGEDH